MPTTVKSSAEYAELGDLSTFSISTAALPVDTADSSGAVPSISATFVDGKDTEYLIGETLSLEAPALGKYDGDIVNVVLTKGTNRYTLDVHNIMARLNTEHRLYPMADYNGVESAYLPPFTLEYWTQQCGIFYSKVPGSPLFFQSQWGHFGAWAKDVTRALKSSLTITSGEVFQADFAEGRLMNNIPRASAATLTFPDKTALTDMGSYLPVLIPSTGYVVFGGTFALNGTSRRGHVTWAMVDPKGNKRHLRVTADTDNGFTLSVSEDGITYLNRGTIAAPANAVYAFYVGVSQTSTATTFNFSVLNSDSTLRGSLSPTVTGSVIRDSLSLTQVVYAGDDVGSGTKLLYADIFISQMETIPTERLAPQKSITIGEKTSTHMVGFSGNVWEHIKQYCSIYHLDMNYRNGLLTIEPRKKDIKVGASLSTLATTVQNRETARNVEVINYQHKATGGTPHVLWSADSVYQVAVGEVQEFVVQTDHSIMSVSQPVCVSGINPFPYVTGAGQYVVTGSDGYIVSPTFWNDQGGSITCDITDTEGEIKIRIKGPDFDSTRAPYRISEGDAGRPALYITGKGVKSDPKTMKVPTGNSKAAKDVGVTIDSPFIGTAKHAYDAAARAAEAFASPEISITFAEPVGYDEDSALGDVPAGELVKSGGNVYRIKEASQTPSMVSGSASQHTTLYQYNRSFGDTATVADVNDYYGEMPLGKVNLKPLKEVK